MPLSRHRLGRALRKPQASVGEAVKLVLDVSGQLIDRLRHCRGRYVSANYVTVDVQLGLGPCRALEPGVALSLQHDSCAQHRLADVAIQPGHALARMILLLIVDDTHGRHGNIDQRNHSLPHRYERGLAGPCVYAQPTIAPSPPCEHRGSAAKRTRRTTWQSTGCEP